MATVIRAQRFIDSIGVCTHLTYTDGGYANVGRVISELKYLGVDNVRDGFQNSGDFAAFATVAAAGVKFTLIVADGAPTATSLEANLASYQAIETDTPGSVIAIEGVNEINNWPIAYDGLSGIAGALAMQRDLYADVHDSPAFAGVAVDYFTGYASGDVPAGPNPSLVGGLADFDTQHPYPTGGEAPGAVVNPANNLTNETGAIGPAVYTETGYSSNGGVSGAVNQVVQAKYTLDLLCDAIKDGVQQTYLYDLMDAYAPGSPQGDDGFGLFDFRNQPKKVAVALHNLTSLLADPGANADTFATGALTPVLKGLPGASSLVLEKSSGEYDVLVWDEPKIWNEATGTVIHVAATKVTMDLGAKYAEVKVYDPLNGANAVLTLHNTEMVNLWVTDHPYLIEVFSAASLAASHS